MMVLVGERPSRAVRVICDKAGWGEMYIYSRPRANFNRSGFDNGAYLDWINQRDFDDKRFLNALDAALDIGIPYMAVVPDLVARGRESLDFSMEWLSRLPAHWPWYLAVQDGMQPAMVKEVVHEFDGIFLGGTDKFKSEAQDWCDLAHIAEKRFHFARAGTERKIKQAIRIGADSLDSSFPLWTMQRLRRMEYLVNDWEQSEPIFKELKVSDYLTDPLALAVLFHVTYEKLAPDSGYETRQETRIFDPESSNGKLMIATCAEIQKAIREAGSSPCA